MLGQQIESDRLFPFVTCSIVDASHAGTMAADMIEHGFDDVRLHAELSHHPCSYAPQIVRCPMRQLFARCLRDPLVESFPAFSPAGERTLAKTENQLSC